MLMEKIEKYPMNPMIIPWWSTEKIPSCINIIGILYIPLTNGILIDTMVYYWYILYFILLWYITGNYGILLVYYRMNGMDNIMVYYS